MKQLFLVLFYLTVLSFSGCNDSTNPADNQIFMRKNVKYLTSTEKKDLVDAIIKLKNTPSPKDHSLSWYDHFVLIHREAFICDESNPAHLHNGYPAHMSPSFLPWHRAFLIEYENALRKVSGKKIVLPYWDWTDEESAAAVFSDDLMGGNGDPNDFYALKTGAFKKGSWKIVILEDTTDDPFQWTHIVRALGTNPTGIALPTKANILEMMNITRYDLPPYSNMCNPSQSFRNYIEGFRNSKFTPCRNGDMDVTDDNWADSTNSDGISSAMHNAVHVWVGGVFFVDGVPASGTMSMSVSPNDPLFFLHHANIDRLWSMWMNKNGKIYEPVTGGPLNSNLKDIMPPFNVSPENLLDSKKNGYYYQEEDYK
jgi:tyrosinase